MSATQIFPAENVPLKCGAILVADLGAAQVRGTVFSALDMDDTVLTLVRKEHFKNNYLMLQKVKNNGNVATFSLSPLESIFGFVRQ